MQWSNFTRGGRDLLQMVLIPLGGLALATVLGVDLLLHGRAPDPWLAGMSVVMMGLPGARLLDLHRGMEAVDGESPRRR